MRKAQIENGVVTNVILVDPDNIPDWCSDWPDATDDAETGGTYANGVFTRPPSPPPAPAPVPASITFAQLLIGLVTEGWLSEFEGEQWLQGTLPPQVTGLIELLPQEQQFAAKARAIRPSAVLRLDPLVVALGAAQNKTPEELDQFFRTYSGV